ncbi:MAG: transcriptional repressor [Acidilobaceae archaeon]
MEQRIFNEIDVAKVTKLMKERGLKVTPQRVLIAKAILENVARHPSLKELYEMVSNTLPGVGVSTVYNTIIMLESVGLIKTFYVEGRLHVDNPKVHINMYCKDRHEILDLEEEIGNEVINVLEKRGIPVRNPTILIIGSCEQNSTFSETSKLP